MSCSFPPAPHIDASVPESTEFSRPTKEDWIRHRELLTQLWSVENKKLSEVMAIMRQHGHIATGRMYKHHFSKWNLDKKFKERDAVTIVRKKRQRDADGKDTEILLRGKAIKMEDVDRYLKRRKGVPISFCSRASTPSDVACRTPPPTGSFQDLDDSQIDQFSTWSTLPQESLDYGSFVASGSSMEQHGIQNFDLIENFMSYHSRISPSPSRPQPFIVPEQLFSSIKSYFHGSFDSGTWVADDNGYCFTLNPRARTINHYPADLMTYCFMAVELLNKGSIVEFGRMLSKGFSIIEDLLQAQHPSTLDYFLNVVVFFVDHKKIEIASVLRTYIGQLAIKILPKDHPWYQICWALSMVEVESFKEVITQSWKYAIDTWSKLLGPFHISSLNYRLGFIVRVYGYKDLLEEERMLRKLLVQVEQQVPSVSPVLVTRVMANLGDNILDQGKHVEAEKIGQAILSLAQRDERSVDIQDKTRTLDMVAKSQYGQDKNDLAEMNSREAIWLVSEKWGREDPWVIELMARLEEWLRQWGREEEADELKAEMESLLKLDEMEEELANIVF
ncbi:hypothetical protein BKA65DRAFT_592287 [Rhexocercosporidium sp. MPI-PUGE-AT-0058]|nr:hypothetical protein BKA65DRAFT_592287 [Rhexocercosporidium sp. MPI-PUGE-AT-0058]